MVSHRTETRDTAPSRAQRLAQTGDVFFQTVRPYQRNNYLFAKPDNNYVFSTGYAQMRPKIDAKFLMCFLQTDSFVQVVLNNCTGTGYPAINSNDLSNLEISLPSSMDNRKSPKIRFPHFTDAWEQRKLGDQMYIKSRIGWQALTKKEYLETGDYYLITGTDIDEDNHVVDLKRCYYVSKERYEMDDKIQVHEGDIIVTKDGTIGKVAMVTGLDKPATLNSHLFVLRDMSGTLDNRFLLQILSSHVFDEFVKSTKTGSTLTGLPQKTFVEFKFLAPRIDEQKEISRYLDDLDNLISLHQRKLGECCGIFLGLTYTPEYVEEGITFISSKDIANDYLDLSEHKYISEEEFNSSSSNAKPIRGDILFTRVGSNLGHPVVIETDEKLCVFVSLGYLRVNKGINNYFMKHWMNSDDFKRQLYQKTGGGAKVNVNTGWLKTFDFYYPASIEEQKKISSFLSELDNLITLHQCKLDELKEYKKGLLQQMFV